MASYAPRRTHSHHAAAVALPLVVLVLVTLWLLLLPISLWARYASGRARRRAQHWVIRGNAWLLAFSVPVLLLSAWLASHWMHAALRDALLGLLLGVLVGIASLWLTRFERDDKGLVYTPNRWLVLGMTTLVALRIAGGLVDRVAARNGWGSGCARRLDRSGRVDGRGRGVPRVRVGVHVGVAGAIVAVTRFTGELHRS